MYLGKITNQTVVANANIPFVTSFNTNRNTVPLTDSVNIAKTGYYDVDLTLTVTGVATSPISAQLYANGVALDGASATTDITATTGIHTLNIHRPIRVTPNTLDTLGNISVRVSQGATVSGNLSIEKRM